MTDALVPYEPTARLNITFSGENGDYPDAVNFDSPDEEILKTAEEGIQSGYVNGITTTPNATLADFVVDRFPATDEMPPRLMVRPKTPFGVDVVARVYSVLSELGCTLHVEAGIVTVTTPEGEVWDFTVPQRKK